MTTPASGAICVVSSISYPSADGANRPAGGQLVNTNPGSNAVEFINDIASLDLSGLEGAGDDSMPLRASMDCCGTRGATATPARCLRADGADCLDLPRFF